MALWGNNDAVGSAGTVVLAYETGVLTDAYAQLLALLEVVQSVM